MKLNLKNIAVLAVIMLTVTTINKSYAQCKSVVKEGMAKLTPYSFNGQTNTVTVKNETPAELHLPFYKGYTYKLQVSSEAKGGKVSFRVLDENKNELYNSNSSSTQADFWVFYSNTAQELIIEVTSTERSKHCVAVLVGVQIPKFNNSMRYL